MLQLIVASALAFPPGFQWCVATAAHQVEGNNQFSDWWTFEHQPNHIKNGEVSGLADDEWNRLAADVALLKELHVTQYRFSVEWAKLEPREGAWDAAAAEHYRTELALLAANGIAPLVTLNHFTLPQWVADKGGWTWPGMSGRFDAYVEKVFTTIGPDVRDWITINEPTVVLFNGYVTGQFPPGVADLRKAGPPASGMVHAHAKAYHTLHRLAAAAGKPVRVGMAHHLRVVRPERPWHPGDQLAATFEDDLFNWPIVDALETGVLKMHVPFLLDVEEEIPEAKGTEDFYGINYYSRDLVRLSLTDAQHVLPVIPPGAPVSDLGWEIYPDGIRQVIKNISDRHGKKPVLITENGLADAADSRRSAFLTDHLTALHAAIAEGYQVESYCHWSLMDNFEWAEGFTPRFGLYAVDYATQTRTRRPSGLLFSKIAEQNQLP